MEPEPIQAPKKFPVLTVVVTFLLTAVITGSAIYLWRESSIAELKNQVTSLENSILETEQKNLLNDMDSDASNDTLCTKCNDEEIYPVIFTPSAEFTEEEKKTLIRKLVKPYFDYYQDSKNTNALDDIISMAVSKNEMISKGYSVVVIFNDRSLKLDYEAGFAAFLFGSTRSEYPYWIPECVNTCTISEEYKQKYPEVIKAFNACLPNACSLYYDFE